MRVSWTKIKLYDKRDDFNFPIVKFPYLEATFLQRLYTVYILHCWSFIQGLVFPFVFTVKLDQTYKEAIVSKVQTNFVSLVVITISFSKRLWNYRKRIKTGFENCFSSSTKQGLLTCQEFNPILVDVML